MDELFTREDARSRLCCRGCRGASLGILACEVAFPVQLGGWRMRVRVPSPLFLRPFVSSPHPGDLHPLPPCAIFALASLFLHLALGVAMLVWPAIDLRGGKCVRLKQGDYGQETVYGDDPAEM